jgi:hypothetical protein
MNPYYSPEFLASAMHRELLDRSAHHRVLAQVRREQKARRLSRKATKLAKRAAELVAEAHR